MSLIEKSKSASDSHRNLVNATAHEPLQGFQPKLTQNICLSRATDWVGLQSYAFRGKGHQESFPETHFHGDSLSSLLCAIIFQ